MSTAVGDNKRLVQKKNKAVKTANIKVSTEDKDLISTKNKSNEKSSNKNKTSIGKNDITDIFQQTKDLEDKLNILKADKERSEGEDFEKIKILNNSISLLDKKHKNLYKTNYSLLSKLKDMQNNLTKEFDNKFKMSKILSKQKKLDNESNLNIQIKAKEMEIQIEERRGEFIQKQYEKLEKMENDGDEKTLYDRLQELKSQIAEYENDINKLKEIEQSYSKKDFDKDYEQLNKKYQVLQNSKEFEMKKKEKEEENEINEEKRKKDAEEKKKKFLEKRKKEKEEKRLKIENREKNGRREKFQDEIKINNTLPPIERMKEYAKEIRKEELDDVEDYDGKKSVKIKKMWDNFSKELNELDQNSLTSRQNKMSKSGNIKTSGNVENIFSSYKSYQDYLKKVTSKIDNSTPKIHLFSEKEKGVMNKYMPKFMEDMNKRYQDVENEINKNLEDMGKKKEEANAVKDSKKLEIDITKMDSKKEEMIKKERKIKINENIKKIYNLKKEIRKLEQMIKEKKKIILKAKKNNDTLRKIIIEIKLIKEQEKNNQEKIEEEGEEGEGEGEEGEESQGEEGEEGEEGAAQ